MADGRQDILEFAALRPGVMDVVRHDHRQAQLVAERNRLGHEPVVVRQAVMRQLEMEGPTEPLRVGPRGGPRPLPIADPQPPRNLAITAAGQADDALRMSREQLLAEARHRLRPREIRP